MVKAIDSKFIGIIRVRSSLTAVDVVCLRHSLVVQLDMEAAASSACCHNKTTSAWFSVSWKSEASEAPIRGLFDASDIVRR